LLLIDRRVKPAATLSRDIPESTVNVFARSLLMVLLLSPSLPAAAGEPSLPWVEQSRALADRLGGELRAELGQAMAQGGPAAAIAICRKRAPEIAAQLSRESGAVVSRTALRVRNPANAPDPLQRAVLEQFRDELASGRFELPLEAVFEVKGGAGVERRYLRAIPTEAVCLACHGPSVAPEVAAALARDYPDDAATGFRAGELRGAISILWPSRVAATNR
jgi:hypothetical protein